jgi:hypothetical protein
MKAWIKGGLSVLILAVLITAVSFYNSYFSVTSGKVIDADGKGIPGAKVSITYLCKTLVMFTGGPSTSVLWITPNKITDVNGEFRFDSYFGRPNLRSCEKFVSAYKEGYCKDQRLCNNALSSPGFEDVPVSRQENYYYYNGSYYDPFYFLERTKIPSKQQYIKLTLNKLE